jgi:hypothetical protein
MPGRSQPNSKKEGGVSSIPTPPHSGGRRQGTYERQSAQGSCQSGARNGSSSTDGGFGAAGLSRQQVTSAALGPHASPVSVTNPGLAVRKADRLRSLQAELDTLELNLATRSMSRFHPRLLRSQRFEASGSPQFGSAAKQRTPSRPGREVRRRSLSQARIRSTSTGADRASGPTFNPQPVASTATRPCLLRKSRTRGGSTNYRGRTECRWRWWRRGRDMRFLPLRRAGQFSCP